MLKDNLIEVEEHIKKACEKSGRNPEDVCLVAVSKTKPKDMLMEVYDCGIRQFGENYVQEMVDKADTLPKDITWHMIGHLQRNKVKYVVGRAALIHSVDSERLAVAISDEAEEFVKKIAVLPGIRIRGFMTSAPFVENPEDNRKYFRELKQLLVDINNKNIDNVYMNVLSMGMTNDYTVAVEEGATHVRVGTAIFGARDYSH